MTSSHVFLLLSTLWCLTLGAILGLSDQEAYYWAWSLKPDLCYYEHPPLQAWLTALSTSAFGTSSFSVRLVPLVARLVGFLIFARWVKTHLKDDRAQDMVVLTMACSFLGLATGILALPDSLLFVFGMLTVEAAEKKSLLKVGVFLGLAALSKWIAIALVPGVLWHLYDSKSFKQTIKNWSVVGALSLVLQAPVLIWNWQHNWVSFRFHLQGRFKHLGNVWPGPKKVFENLVEFSGSQILLLSLSVFAVLAILIFQKQVRRHFVRPKMGTWIWILPFYLLFGSAALRGELRFYWTAFACFPMALAIFESWPAIANVARLRFGLWMCGILTMVMVSLVLIAPVGAWIKPFTDTYKVYDLRHSPRGDLDGWIEFGDAIKAQGLFDDSTAVMTSNFRVSAQMMWGLKLKSPDAVGVAEWTQMQFEIWSGPQFNAHRFKRALFVSDNRYWITEHFQKYCGEPLTYQTFQVQRLGHTIKTIKWASCSKFLGEQVPHKNQ